MNQSEFQSNPKDDSFLLVENCLTFISLQNKNGKRTLYVDIRTTNSDYYFDIQELLAERGAEFLEYPDAEMNRLITNFEIDTELNLWLQNHKPNNL